MEKEYRELFDQVHASPALRMEVLHMKERQRPRRRIPAAALAAVLVLVLTGTALAVGALGLVHADFVDISTITGGESREGVLAQGEVEPRSLSEQALERVTGKSDMWSFDSLEEAETFLGLEIADNDVLAQMEPKTCQISRSDMAESFQGVCLVEVTADPLGGVWVPRTLEISSSYQGENCMLWQSVSLLVDHPNRWRRESDPGLFIPTPEGGIEVEDYVTPSGLEVKIVTNRYPQFSDETPANCTHYDAFFVLNNAFFNLSTSVGEADVFYYTDSDLALAELKAALDAYK